MHTNWLPDLNKALAVPSLWETYNGRSEFLVPVKVGSQVEGLTGQAAKDPASISKSQRLRTATTLDPAPPGLPRTREAAPSPGPPRRVRLAKRRELRAGIRLLRTRGSPGHPGGPRQIAQEDILALVHNAL